MWIVNEVCTIILFKFLYPWKYMYMRYTPKQDNSSNLLSYIVNQYLLSNRDAADSSHDAGDSIATVAKENSFADFPLPEIGDLVKASYTDFNELRTQITKLCNNLSGYRLPFLHDVYDI